MARRLLVYFIALILAGCTSGHSGKGQITSGQSIHKTDTPIHFVKEHFNYKLNTTIQCIVVCDGKFILLAANHRLYSIDTGTNILAGYTTDPSLKLTKIVLVHDTLFGLEEKGDRIYFLNNKDWKLYFKVGKMESISRDELFEWREISERILSVVYEDDDYLVYDRPIFHAFNGRQIYFYDKKNGKTSKCGMSYNNFSISRIDSSFVFSGTVQGARCLIEFAEIQLPEKQFYKEYEPSEKPGRYNVCYGKRKTFMAKDWNEYYSFNHNGKLLFLASPKNIAQHGSYPFYTTYKYDSIVAKVHPDDVEIKYDHPQNFIGIYSCDTGAIHLIDTILSVRLYSFKDSTDSVDNIVYHTMPAAYPDEEHRKQYSDIVLFYEINMFAANTTDRKKENYCKYMNLCRNFVAIKGNKIKVYHFDKLR